MSESSEKDQKSTPPTSGLGGAAARPAPGETASTITSPPEPPAAEPDGDDDGPKTGDELRKLGAPEALAEAAGGPLDEGLTDRDSAEASQKEAGALDFMLSNPSPQPFHVDVMVETPKGLKKLRFHMHQLDGSRIEALEE